MSDGSVCLLQENSTTSTQATVWLSCAMSDTVQIEMLLPPEKRTILENLREFKRTFQEKYRRPMNDEEEAILHAVEKILLDKFAKEYPLKDGQ